MDCFTFYEKNSKELCLKLKVMVPKEVNYQGPVVQSIISLTSWLVVKMLTVQVKTISNSQEFLLKKCEKLLHLQKLFIFFLQKY